MSNLLVKHDGVVANILDVRKLVINKGSVDGISGNEKFVVFDVGQEIHDPNTGESLGQLELVKGRGKVIHVQDRICTIETYDYEVVKRQNDWVSILSPVEERKNYKQFIDVKVGDYARIIR